MHPKPSRSQYTGYTLIEILISLFIFSILILMVSQALNSTTTNHEILSKHAKRLLEIQIAFSIINTDFEQIVNKKKLGLKSTLQPVFLSNPDSLEFTHMGYLNPNHEAKRSTLQTVRYLFPGDTLVRQDRPILTGIQNIHLQFLGPDKKWYSIWPPTQHWAKTLPIGIRVDCLLKDIGLISRIFILAGEEYVSIPA